MRQLLRIAYDGTDFHGYARQRGGSEPRTVQGEIEHALARIYKTELPTQGASRTDAGVHAEGQLVAFVPPFEIPPRGLLMALAGQLPQDVAAVATWQEQGRPEEVRHGNQGKHYRYRVRCHPIRDPLRRRTEWHLARPLDLQAMNAAAASVVGTHDFSAFRAADCQAKTTQRTMTAVSVVPVRAPVGPSSDLGGVPTVEREEDSVPSFEFPEAVEIHVRGEAFLKNMVRILAGTLVDVGLGRRAPDLETLLQGAPRHAAGPTAPAQGLTLVEVLWAQHEPPATPRLAGASRAGS